MDRGKNIQIRKKPIIYLIASNIVAFVRKDTIRLCIYLLLLLSIFQSIWFFKNGIYNSVDGGFDNYISLHIIYTQFFLWMQYNYTGLMNTIPSILGTFFSFIQYIFVTVLGYTYGAEIFYGIMIAIGSISIFMLLLEILPPRSERSIYLSFISE